MISVLIPYRDDGNRHKQFGWVAEWWGRYFPNAEFIVTDSGRGDFHRGEARNTAFGFSHGDVIILADADTVPNAAAVTDAIDLVYDEKAPWVIPYGEKDYYNLTETRTQEILSGHLKTIPEPEEGQWDHQLTSWAGCLIMPREAFVEAGGYDSRFLGWGGEDNAFRLAMDTLWGPHRRVDFGWCCHLWHPRSEEENFGQPNIEHNLALRRQYEGAFGNVSRMKALVQR